MKLAIFLDVLSTHQEGLCNAFYDRLGNDFKTVLFGKLPQYRIDAGFTDLSDKYSYTVVLPEDKVVRNELLKDVVNWADVGIVGGVTDRIFDSFLAQGKKCFLFSERFYKKGTWRCIIPSTLKSVRRRIREDNNFAVLCASAFLPYDLRISGYKGKMLQWGYFPNIEIDSYNRGGGTPISILWTGRFIKWKHPETCIRIAEKLKRDDIEYRLTIVGYGELKDNLLKMISDKGLVGYVDLKDAMPPQEIHKLMGLSDIFLATSDYHEGWGVVVNEAMTAGCTVVASSAMGAVPFMIRDGENGFSCRWNDYNKYYSCVKQLIEDSDLRNLVSQNAIATMTTQYSPSNAVDCFCRYLEGEQFASGIMSEAEVRKR